MRRIRTVWREIVVVLGLLTIGQVLDSIVLAQSPPAEAQLTILVRDADGNPMPDVVVEMYLPQPPAEPRQVADVRTGADGRVTVQRLDPNQTYVIQFQSGAWTILDGKQVGSKSMQFRDDQNAGRELLSPADPPGFPVQLGGQSVATLRFVIGGTFAEGDLVAAVPMFDLAESDDAAVRPVNPLTGEEMTPEQARTFHAVVGQPWGVARGGEVSPEPLATVPGAAAVSSGAAVPLPSAAAGGTGSSRPTAPIGSSPLALVLIATIVLLVAVIGILLVRQRRRPG